ncbi:MAG: rhodanese-like domain-containing protein [Actinomycetota bacterium]
MTAAACGSETSEPATATQDTESGAETGAASDGLRLVSPDAGASILADPPDDLVVLDVRTPEEFAEGHLADATLVDFYTEDFADQLAALDPDVPYLIYCRSGNRSGQTLALMEELGFTDVADVDGGILAWADAGLPVTP